MARVGVERAQPELPQLTVSRTYRASVQRSDYVTEARRFGPRTLREQFNISA
jgi:hypothetical protein